MSDRLSAAEWYAIQSGFLAQLGPALLEAGDIDAAMFAEWDRDWRTAVGALGAEAMLAIGEKLIVLARASQDLEKREEKKRARRDGLAKARAELRQQGRLSHFQLLDGGAA